MRPHAKGVAVLDTKQSRAWVIGGVVMAFAALGTFLSYRIVTE